MGIIALLFEKGKMKKEVVDIILDIDECERTLWKLHQSDASAWTNEREKNNKYLKLCVNASH
jgi:hypothetical protein